LGDGKPREIKKDLLDVKITVTPSVVVDFIGRERALASGGTFGIVL